MNRIILIILLLHSISFTIGQKATITVSHTVKYDTVSVFPDSILISNISSPGDTSLYGSDTALVLDFTTGLPDGYSNKYEFLLQPAYPNPFLETTNFNLMIPENGQVTIKVYDSYSRLITQHQNNYSYGNHKFSFIAGKDGLYFLNVSYLNKSQSVKVFCNGSKHKVSPRINYIGISSSINKMTDAINSFVYSFGDELRSIVFYQSMADSTIYTPTQDTLITVIFQSSSNCPTSFVDSRDGHTYSAVQIGSQCWMAENLAYLPAVSPANTGSNTKEYYYVYNYQGTDVNAAKSTIDYQTYGVLYNWLAAMDGSASSNQVPSGIQGACPAGWHVPSDEEFKILEGEVDGQFGYPSGEWDGAGWRGSDAGGNLKETGTTHWNNPNTGATNSSNFTAIPGGARYYTLTFYDKGVYASFWTAYESSPLHGWYRNLSYSGYQAYRGDYYKENAFSLRCIMD